MNLKSFASGLGVGAVVGAVVTLLSTPKTGAEMREILRDKVDEARRAAVEAKEEHYTIGDVINEINEAKEVVEDKADAVGGAVSATA